MKSISPIIYDAFISYAWRESNLGAETLDTKLQSDGLRVWRDKRDADPTEDFRVEIENAISSASCVIVCVTSHVVKPDSYVQREIAYAQTLSKPIFVCRHQNVEPPESIRWLTWIDFLNHEQWQVNYPRLKEWVQRKANPDKGKISPVPQDPYRTYVEALYRQIVTDLDLSVFSENVIQLESQSRPNSVNQTNQKPRFVMMRGRTTNSPQNTNREFVDFSDAYVNYEGRVLLMGEAGAGKTTSLLAFARNATAARLMNRSHRLPILVRAASWDSRNETPLTAWLAREMSIISGANFTANEIEKLISDDDALIMVDGLDELDHERPLDLNNPDGETYNPRVRFISQIPQVGHVILTCRETEFQQLGVQLKLNGAVVLKPLDDARMYDYLSELPDLLTTLQHDNTLRNALRTPLLLALFRESFDKSTFEASQLHDLHGEELRQRIWMLFIESRYNYEETRHNTLRQENGLSEEPLPYKLSDIVKFLGYTAVSMLNWVIQDSTTFSPAEIKFEKTVDLIKFIQRLQLIKYVGKLPRQNVVSIFFRSLETQSESYSFIHLELRNVCAIHCGRLLLSSDSALDRIMGAKALGIMKDQLSVPKLAELLKDEERGIFLEVCQAAEFALTQIGTPDALKAIESWKESLPPSTPAPPYPSAR